MQVISRIVTPWHRGRPSSVCSPLYLSATRFNNIVPISSSAEQPCGALQWGPTLLYQLSSSGVTGLQDSRPVTYRKEGRGGQRAA